MLSRQEKDDLMTVIDILFDDSQLRGLKSNFNERTVEAVELAMEELVKCNASMKDLVTGLTAGFAVFTRGWLRQSLDKIARNRSTNYTGMVSP